MFIRKQTKACVFIASRLYVQFHVYDAAAPRTCKHCVRECVFVAATVCANTVCVFHSNIK